MRGDIFSAEHMAEPATHGGMMLENPYCIRYAVNGELLARQGAMVAYRGNLAISTKGQGAKNFLKRAVTGEGVALMTVQGQGEIWLAEEAKQVFVLTLDPGDGLSVSGKSVLCFDPSLAYDIKMVSGAGMVGGGLFNCIFTGEGQVAIAADGEPFVVPVTAQYPVFVDTDAVIAWSASLQTSIRRSEGMKSMLRGGSGEMFQLALQGQGFVVVQPSEGPKVPQQSGGGGGGVVSGLLSG